MKNRSLMKHVICFLTVVLILVQSSHAQNGGEMSYTPDLIEAESSFNPSTADNIRAYLTDDDDETVWRSGRTISPWYDVNAGGGQNAGENDNMEDRKEYIELTFNNATIINKLELYKVQQLDSRTDVRAFYVKGSDNNDDWSADPLYISTDAKKFNNGIPKESFEWVNEQPYHYYRIYITKNRAGSPNYMRNISLSKIVLIGPRRVLLSEDINLEIYQIKVSEGHATLLVVKNTEDNTVVSSTLIDAGNTSADGRKIIEVIKSQAGGRLDRVFITHDHNDHFGGLYSDNPSGFGILALRSSPGYSEEVNSIFNNNPNPLDLYYNTTTNLLPLEDLNKVDWDHQTADIELGILDSNIKLKTLAVEGLMEGGLPISGKINSENDDSAVILVSWDDFSFLIQGDLEADPNTDNTNKRAGNSEIGFTNDIYKPDSAEPTTTWRIPSVWTGSPAVQKGKTLAPSFTDNTTRDNEGIIRHSSTFAVGRKRKPDAGTEIESRIEKYQHAIAFPDESRHTLGTIINNNNNNGQGNYAHTCIALAPHHGATTANLWFDLAHVIIGSNKTNKHRHPQMDAVEAMYHTSGARNFYFTYLKNTPKYPAKMLFDIRRGDKFNNGETYHVIDNKEGTKYSALTDGEEDNGDFFKFTVKQNDDDEDIKEFSVIDQFGEANPIRPFAICDRAHNNL